MWLFPLAVAALVFVSTMPAVASARHFEKYTYQQFRNGDHGHSGRDDHHGNIDQRNNYAA